MKHFVPDEKFYAKFIKCNVYSFSQGDTTCQNT